MAEVMLTKRQELIHQFSKLMHSTWAPSSSKAAMAGVTVEELIHVADWSGEGVFQKFYYCPKHSLAYGSKVLAIGTSKSHVDMETKPSKI